MSISTPWWVDFVAGWCSGATSLILCQPLDTILTRRQAASVIKNHSAKYFLWRGVSPMIGAVPIQNALLMAGYGFGKRWNDNYHDIDAVNNLALMGVFIGGCTGGILQSFIMSPIELIKVTQQVWGQNMTTALTTIGAFEESSKNANVFRSSLWRGLGATLWRDGIPHGVWFLSYEFLKNELDKQKSESGIDSNLSNINMYNSLSAGAFAATCAWLVGYPFDIIKTRIQSDPVHRGVWATAHSLIQESGNRPIQALYKGLSLKLLRAIPASAIGFTTYEWFKTQLTLK